MVSIFLFTILFNYSELLNICRTYIKKFSKVQKFGTEWLDEFFGTAWILNANISHFDGVLHGTDPPDNDITLSIYREAKLFNERSFRSLFNRKGVLFHVENFFSGGRANSCWGRN